MTGPIPPARATPADLVRYVPILKAREGELGALEKLSDDERRSMLPLLEVPPVPWDFEAGQPSRTLRAHVASVATRLQRAWGVNRALLLDFSHLGASEVFEDGNSAAGEVLQQAVALDVRVVPVVSRRSSMAYLETAGEHARRHDTGACVRLSVADFDDEVDLSRELHRVSEAMGGMRISEIDLLVDLRDLRNETSRALLEARAVLQAVPEPLLWRRLILGASSFPPDLSEVDPASPSVLPRREWELWTALHRRPDRLPPRQLVYCDYAIAHPDVKELDPRTMRMSASIRYTAPDHYLVIKGRNVRQYGYDQYFDLSKTVTKLPEYSGRHFSWGDSYIYDCAQEMTGPGNATTWRKVGTNHHLVLVAGQLSAAPL